MNGSVNIVVLTRAFANGAHIADQFRPLQETLIFIGDEMAAAISVEDDWRPFSWLARWPELSLDHPLMSATASHRPTNNDVGIGIECYVEVLS